MKLSDAKVNALLCAIVCGIGAGEGQGAPLGILYAGVLGECDKALFDKLVGILVVTGTCRREGLLLHLTEKGAELHARIEAHAKRAA